MSRKVVSILIAAVLLFAPATRGVRASHVDPESNPDSLYHRALVRCADSTSLDLRRAGLVDFTEAARLAPKRADIWLAYGQACLDAGEFARGRACLRTAADLLPEDADAWQSLAVACKRGWLMTLDRTSLDEAARCYAHAGACDSTRADCWAAASAMELLRGRTREALVDAQCARHADLAGAGPLLAIGAVFYRMSILSYADSAFHAARDRLPPELQRRFDQPPFYERRHAGVDDPAVAAASSGRSWADFDPDLTTPENEAQLDYWTRFSLVTFLFRDGDRIRWDQRADLILRYGLPQSVELNPAGMQLGEAELEYAVPSRAPLGARPPEHAPPPILFAYNLQLWHYPDLGMHVVLWDRSLVQDYELPPSEQYDMDPRPDPAALAVRPDLMALADGRGVLRTMAPGARPMAVLASTTRYPLADGTRLLAHVVAPGERADSMWGAWTVLAEDGHVVARQSAALMISACDPTEHQVGEFATTLPPGRYRVDLTVRGPHGGRGLAHLFPRIEPPADGLEISDLVLACGDEATSIGRDGVRVEPNLEGRVSSSTLTAYYELEHLATGADGRSSFSYRYTVARKPARPDEEVPAVGAIEVSRDESNVGTHRRQFVSIPIASLAPGTYQLRIEVRDLIAGRSVDTTIEFRRGLR